LVAFCLRHFSADSIICMYVFEFRQAQPFVLIGMAPWRGAVRRWHVGRVDTVIEDIPQDHPDPIGQPDAHHQRLLSPVVGTQ